MRGAAARRIERRMVGVVDGVDVNNDESMPSLASLVRLLVGVDGLSDAGERLRRERWFGIVGGAG